jgi:hypothetical protein
MDRHVTEDQLDRAIAGFLSERRNQMVAAARPAHVAAARVGSLRLPRADRRGHRLTLTLLILTLTALLAGIGLLVGSQPVKPSPAPLIPAERGLFTSTGSMAGDREGHAATLLPDGRVLIVGGRSSGGDEALKTSEIWDQATESFTPTGSMAQGRYHPTATLLQTGQVLVVGGTTGAIGSIVGSAEIWDPNTRSFSPAGSLSGADVGHPAKLLPDGRVLVGRGSSAEIWDPSTRSFGPAGTLADGNDAPDGTRLADGRVLVINGTSKGDGSAWVWDPVSATSSATQSFSLPSVPGSTVTLSGLTTTLLRDGRVLAVGGFFESLIINPCPSPKPRVQATASPTAGRARHPASAGSASCKLGSGGVLDAAVIWDPATGVFSPTGSLNIERHDATATLLPDGRVLVVGGGYIGGTTASAELFELK